MRASQFYKYAAIVLFVLNLAVLAFVFLGPGGPPPPGSRQNAQEILKLDDQQHEAFLAFAEKHVKEIEALEEQQRRLLRPYFNSITDTTISFELEALMQEVQEAERKKIELTHQHFRDVKSLLRPEQQAYFKGFIKPILNALLMNKKQPPGPPKGK